MKPARSTWLTRALRPSLAVAVLVFAAFGAVFAGGASCASPPDSKLLTEVIQPDYATYKTYVDTYLQRRCGTLDCHGQPGRAYRIYGFTGFRLDGGFVSGQQPTTEDEIKANYQAAVALEPEEMSRLMATQGEDPEKLVFLRKAMKLERHKGGPAMTKDDDGYRCVVGWLRVRVVRPTADNLAFEPIPPAEREKLPLAAQQACKAAESVP